MSAYFLFYNMGYSIVKLQYSECLKGSENMFCMNKPFTPSTFHTPWQGKDPSSYLVLFFFLGFLASLILAQPKAASKTLCHFPQAPEFDINPLQKKTKKKNPSFKLYSF